MAKIFGLNGIIRGRQGNNVFSVQNGVQVLKQYQPAVANPRSDGQTIQRTKFALAGKMSGATPTVALSGMIGGNARDKRARFVELLLRATSVTSSETGYRAAVPLADVLYSEGSLATYSSVSSVTAVWAGTSIIAQNNITVTISMGQISNNRPAGYSELYVVALYDSETNNLEVVQATERSQSSVVFNLRAGYQHNCYVAVYQVPFVRLSSLSRPVSSNVGATETDAFLNASRSSLIAGSEWGRSMLVQVIGVLGAENVHTSISSEDNDDMREVDDDSLKSYIPAKKKK